MEQKHYARRVGTGPAQRFAGWYFSFISFPVNALSQRTLRAYCA